MKRDFATVTDPGSTRELNEDSHAFYPDAATWLVADGVGGHASGEVASRIVCSTVGEELREGHSLDVAVRAAHEAVLKEIDSRDSGQNMGSTVVAIQLHDDTYTLAWVGDSRAYRWNGKLEQLTRDHTHVEDLVERGILTREQASDHPQRHMITQSLGVSREMDLEVEVQGGRLAQHDQVLLCSDGLTDELSDAQIALELQRNADPDSQARSLVSKALEAGGRDNVTVTVLGAIGERPDTDITMELPPREAKRSGGGSRWMWGLAAAGILLLLLIVWGG